MDLPNPQINQPEVIPHAGQWTPGDQDSGPHHEPAAQIHDCWNTIGVNGNSSCRELTRFTHCRNCPVYSAAAAQLLDRPIPPEQRREWTEHYAREKKLSTPARTSVVIFRIGHEWLGLPTPAFQEVAEQRTIHTLPHRRRGVVMGLVNIRGELVICASLSRLLGLAETPSARREMPDSMREPPVVYHRLLVTQWDGQRQVFPVDEVHGILRVQHDELHEPPATVARSTNRYLTPSPPSTPLTPGALREGGGLEGGEGHRFTRRVFSWREHTVGLLDADVLFTTLNRNLT